MQMKILGAVVIATGLTLAGCGGSSGSSSSGSTGTTGNTTSQNTTGNTTSQTTSTGTSSTGTSSTGTSSTGTSSTGTNGSGSTGTTGSQCSPACDTAHGETCNSYTNPSGSGTVHACGCKPGTQTAPDSCANNTDGNIVCDQETLHCRLPRDYDTANEVGVFPDGGGNPECDDANGYSPVTFCYSKIVNGVCQPFGDGGSAEIPTCVQLCLGAGDCSSQTFYCRKDNPFTNTADGGVFMVTNPADGGLAALSFCDFNACGPTASDDGGLLNSDYFGACDAHGTGDGTCLPLGFGATGDIAICSTTNPDAGILDACNPDYLAGWTAQGCGAESYCAPTGGPPNETGICLQMCNADTTSGVDQLGCPTFQGQALTCQAFGFAIADGGLQPGACE